MKLSETLFTANAPLIFLVHYDFEDTRESAYLDWDLEPINGPSLAAEYVPNGLLDGLFILGARSIADAGQSSPCYVDISMPEGVVTFTYVRENNRVSQKYIEEFPQGSIVPCVPIEYFVDYQVFYSRKDPEVGIEVLKQGLKDAHTKWPIALALGRTLRDEGRYEEAVFALELAVREGPEFLRRENEEELNLIRRAAIDRGA